MRSLVLLLLLLSGLILNAQASEVPPRQDVKVQVTEKGFEPSEIKLKPGSHVVLKVTRTTDATCATSIQVKQKQIKANLPLNKQIEVDLGIVQKGDIRFACGMDMISGHIIAE